MAIKHKSEIKINVGMDENRVPEKLSWDASDGGITNEVAKAMMLSVWDEKTNDTLRIDLWTKEMLMDDMKRFFHQTFLAMADSFERATNETSMAADMRDFAAHFAEKMELISKDGQ
jgi:gliding motility-associated protein GldC